MADTVENETFAQSLETWRKSTSAEAKLVIKDLDLSFFFAKTPPISITTEAGADMVLTPSVTWDSNYSALKAYIEVIKEKKYPDLTQKEKSSIKKEFDELSLEEKTRCYLHAEFRIVYRKRCFTLLGIKNFPPTARLLYSIAAKEEVKSRASGVLVKMASGIASASFNKLSKQDKRKHENNAVIAYESIGDYVKGVPNDKLPKIDMHILDDGVNLLDIFLSPSREILCATVKDSWKTIDAAESFTEDAVAYDYNEGRANSGWFKSSEVITKGQHFWIAGKKREFFTEMKELVLSESLHRTFHTGLKAFVDVGLGPLFLEEKNCSAETVELRYFCLPDDMKNQCAEPRLRESFSQFRAGTIARLARYYTLIFGKDGVHDRRVPGVVIENVNGQETAAVVTQGNGQETAAVVTQGNGDGNNTQANENVGN